MFRQAPNLHPEVKPVGGFWPVLPSGAIGNDAALEKIPASGFPLIEKLISIYRLVLGPSLHSIYLRGSFPRGLPAEYVHDIDSLALATEVGADSKKILRERIRPVEKEHPEFSRIEMEVFSLSGILSKPRSALAFTIKVESLCIAGENIHDSIPDFFPNKDLAAAKLRKFLEAVALVEESMREQPPSPAKAVWLAKRYLRAGFLLVMEREQRYTRDLYVCWEAFSRHFPEHRDAMRVALEAALVPERRNANGTQDSLMEIGAALKERVALYLDGAG